MRPGLIGGTWKVLFVICGLLLMILGLRGGHAVDVGVGLLAVAVALVATQTFRRGVSRMRARHQPEPDYDAPVVIFWRPGCPFCTRMRHQLGAEGERAEWINIWAHDAAMAMVKAANGGDETVPTVRINGAFHTNPHPEEVRAALAAQRQG